MTFGQADAVDVAHEVAMEVGGGRVAERALE